MDLITIDFESYYDKQYSLSKITTEEYIRSPKFEVIGVGVKLNDGEARWITGTHEQLKRILHRDYDFENAAVLAHNTMFDGAILSWIFDIHPRVLFDTLCMARAIHGVDAGGSLAKLAVRYKLGEKGTEVVDALGKRRADFSYEELKRYGQYCINDVELTYKLFNKMVPVFPKKELKIIDMTLRMFTEPTLALDAPKLKAHLQTIRDNKQRILDECGLDLKGLMSNNKFAEALRGLGVKPPMKTSPRTGKETYAFAKSDPGLKELADHDDPDVQALVAARTKLKSTLEETRTERFLDIASRGKLPVPIKYYAAHTGRWGGCLVADTEVTVYNETNGVETKRIVDVLLGDLVWDGEAFVEHGGVQFSGYDEVIEWDGVTGTADHKVFTEVGEVSLSEAMQGAHRIEAARSPTQDDVDAAREYVRNHKSKDTV